MPYFRCSIWSSKTHLMIKRHIEMAILLGEDFKEVGIGGIGDLLVGKASCASVA